MDQQRQQCQQFADQGFTMIPVYRRLIADGMTPVTALARLCQHDDYHFLFESVVGGERIARYSMLGVRPRARLVGNTKQVELISGDNSQREILAGDDPYDAIRQYMSQFSSPECHELPRFLGGLVGYFGYDVVRIDEHLPDVPSDTLGLPDIHLMHCDTVVVFDHSFNQLYLIAHLDLTEGHQFDTEWERAEKTLEQLQHQLAAPIDLPPVLPQEVPPLQYRQHTSKDDFCRAVEELKEYIRAGDIFQVVPSQRLSADISVSPFQVYRSIRSLNPSPYLFCLGLGETSLVGASPEIMVRVEDGEVAVRPIAGTIHRGQTPEEDEALGQQLLADPKERAEHVMLIDLGRNDVGRVAQQGSVQLEDEMVIERYSHVQHIVSHVSGQLRDDLDALDAVRCCHPAGTVSGAPKIRAMQLIDQYEPVKRGPYAGAVGYLDFRGNLDTCIALRTAILTKGEAHVQAGAGVVADSVPEKEYQETLNKAQAMLQAIARANQF